MSVFGMRYRDTSSLEGSSLFEESRIISPPYEQTVYHKLVHSLLVHGTLEAPPP